MYVLIYRANWALLPFIHIWHLLALETVRFCKFDKDYVISTKQIEWHQLAFLLSIQELF